MNTKTAHNIAFYANGADGRSIISFRKTSTFVRADGKSQALERLMSIYDNSAAVVDGRITPPRMRKALNVGSSFAQKSKSETPIK